MCVSNARQLCAQTERDNGSSYLFFFFCFFREVSASFMPLAIHMKKIFVGPLLSAGNCCQCYVGRADPF